MRKHWLKLAAVTPLVLGVAAVTPSANADPSDSELAEIVDQILSDSRLEDGQASVLIAEAADGEVLYERNADTRQMPASNTKLLTSAAALDLLGPDYRWTTSAATDGTMDSGNLKGDLYLVGGADPTMLAEDYRDLAAQLADAGVDKIHGDLVADDTFLDKTRLGLDWAWDDLPYYYAAQVSGLTVAPDTDYDAGTVYISAAAGDSPGDDPVVTLTPDTDYVDIDMQGVTVGEGETDTLSIKREHGSNTVTISGQIPTDANPTRVWSSVWEPTGYAADVFESALEAEGIDLKGDVRLGAAPDEADTVAEHDSMPLSELLIPFMKLSNNGHAEVLTKTIGRELADSGSWNAGLNEISDFLAESGLDVDTMRQADGSGLSRWNLIPAREFAQLLLDAQDQPWFDTWLNSFPIACESERMVGGTLRSRMCDTPAEDNARAKTGTLTGATALSGYVTDSEGRLLVFSIVMNDYLSSSPKDLEDQIVQTLAAYPDVSPELATTDAPEAPEDNGLECSWTKSC